MNAKLTRRAPLALALLALFALLSPTPARAQGYTFHTLHSFAPFSGNGPNLDGAYSNANVTLDGMGHLYGTARDGGPNGYGTLFEEDIATKTFTTLVSFNSSNGAFPYSPVTLDGQGHLYGTTVDGGSNPKLGKGTVFEYDLSSGTLTTLIQFNGSNGANPYAAVTLDGQGHLYGTTYRGGDSNSGTVFEYDLSSGTLTTLVTFKGGNGRYPRASVTLDGQGHLYGTTVAGGNSNDGTVFVYDLASGTRTTIVSFNGKNGRYVAAPVVLDGQGHLYGTTNTDIQGPGTLFKVNIATRHLTTLIYFNGTNGNQPWGGVALDGQGHLYGTTQEGSRSGTVYKYNLATHVLTTFLDFNGNTGDYPFAGVTLDDGGSLYGTTYQGGAHNTGTVYELTPNP